VRVKEFRARLGAAPHTFLEFSLSQLLQNSPLHPVAEWGRQRFGAHESAARRLADLEHTLRLIGLDPAEYAPLLAPLANIPLPEKRAAKLAPEELRRRQLAALTEWVLAGARSQPVALSVEDLHWADPTSLDLMQALAERGEQVPLFIIATTRPEFRPPWSLRAHDSVISATSPEALEDWLPNVEEVRSLMSLRHSESSENVGLAHRRDPNKPDLRIQRGAPRSRGQRGSPPQATVFIVDQLYSVLGLSDRLYFSKQREAWRERTEMFWCDCGRAP
jgi:hypothetical protein